MLVSPLRIYNTIDKDPMKKRVNPRKHRYVINKPDGEIDQVELHHLREQVYGQFQAPNSGGGTRRQASYPCA